MNYKNRIFIMILTLLGMEFSRLEATKILLVSGKDQIQEIETDDESTHCVVGMPFDESDDALLAIEFDTHPAMTCYIGQIAWYNMFQQPGALREDWLNNGLDPAKRPVRVVRIFKRGRLPHSYEFERSIYLIPNTAHACAERQQLISAPELADAQVVQGVDFFERFCIDAPKFSADYEYEERVALLNEIRLFRVHPVSHLILPELLDKVIQSLTVTVGRVLDLSAAHITTEQLRQIIDNLPARIQRAVRILYVQHNQLCTLPAEIIKFKNLREIWADNNQITVLPREIILLHSLTDLIMDWAIEIPTPIRLDRVILHRV